MGRLRPGATIAEVGVVAALYAALTVVLQPASYGPLQFRVAEVLKSLVIWEPHLIAAFVLGNFLANLASPYAGPWELVFMPFANLIGAWGCYALGRRWPYAGAALYVAGLADSPRAGCRLALEIIADGSAWQRLGQLAGKTRSFS